MRALDSDGHELEQAQIGKPFTLEVSVSGGKGDIADPRIERTQDFAIRNTARQINNINGTMSMRYSYVVRIDTQGSHSIGPAVVQDDAGSAQSNVLIIKAGSKEVARYDKQFEKQQKKILLTIAANQQEYVVGQKIEGTITFLFASPVDKFFGIAAPEIDGFVVKDNSMRQSVVHLDGVQYSSATWDWSLFSKQPGELVIPSCVAEFAVQREDDFGSLFSSFLHMRSERKRIHSNALTVNVLPLPSHTEPVDAVGIFQNFEIGLNQAAAKEGDGIVVELSIEGETDLENLSLELQNVPHTFKSYSSKQKITDAQKSGMPKKYFEYIIQGMEVGEWKIPEQKFTYYDTESFSYKTLKTAPLLVKILPQSTTKKYVPPPEVDAISTAIDTQQELVADDFPLNTNGRWYEIPERKIPWWLFMVLFFAPLLMWISKIARRFFRAYTEQRAPKVRWRNAFKIAHKKIERAKKQEDFPALYRIFTELFATRFSMNDSLISEQVIVELLRKRGVSEGEIDEWSKFFAELSSFIFYTVHGSEQQKKLFDQANKWVVVLKEVI